MKKNDCSRELFQTFSLQQKNLNAAINLQFFNVACKNFPCTFPNNKCNQKFANVIIYSIQGFSTVDLQRIHLQWIL